jgi:hypothetical protein
MEKEYMLVFERADGAIAALRVSADLEKVSNLVAEIVVNEGQGYINRCYISEVVNVMEFAVIDQESETDVTPTAVEVPEENSN